MKAFIFANGDFPHPEAILRSISSADLLIAADAGFKHLRKLGLLPAIIIGDLDSIDPTDLAFIQSLNIKVIKHPATKDKTDLELCLSYALSHSVEEIIITGAFGGRVDQILGNMILLTDPNLVGRRVKLDDGQTEAFFLPKHRTIAGRSGDTISLIPWGMPVSGVTTSGLAYSLKNETLLPYSSRSISNVMTSDECQIGFDHGTLFCVHIRKERED